MSKTRGRNVKTDSAALAPPSSAGRPLPKPRGAKPLDMADALENQVSGLGTRRDKRHYSEYHYVHHLSEWQLRAMFRNSWLAKRIVRTPAEDMTREWVTAKWDGMTKDDQAAIRRSERRFGVKPKTHESLTWARLYGGCCIVVGTRGQKLEEPLDLNRMKKGSLMFLRVRDRYWIFPVGLVDQIEETPAGDPNPNYGLPVFYSIRGSSVRVHWSRVIRFEGTLTPYDDTLSNNFWADSELQHVMTATKDFDGATENVASMLWEAKVDVIKTALAKMIATKDWAAIERRYQDAALGKSNHRTLLLDTNEEYDSKIQQFGGVHDILGDFVIFACGAAQIPMVKLFGQSAPGMNSTGDTDLRIYYDHVASEAEWQMMPPLERLYQILVRDALGRMPDGFELEAKPLWQISDKDQATIGFQNAQRDQIAINAGWATPQLIARENLARGTYQTMEQDDVDEIVKAAEEKAKRAAAMPTPPAPGAPAKNEPAAPTPSAQPKQQDPTDEPATPAG